jgi:DNA-directed RNA polymerase specialized sigma24 family protein
MGYRDVAKHFGITKSAVHRRLTRILGRLRESLTFDDADLAVEIPILRNVA